MSPTPLFGLRYPDSADDLNVGAINLQQLAEDVEGVLDGPLRPTSWITSDLGAGPAQTATVGGVQATHGGVTAGPDWSWNGSDAFTYTGPLRWFAITASLKIDVTGAAGSTASSTAKLQANGVDASRSQHSTTVATLDGAAVFSNHTHKLDTVLVLATGSVLTMQAFGDSAVSDKVLRAVSIGGV